MAGKIVLTGVKPTGSPHIGNYVGAIRPALELSRQEETTSLLFIADYHALTTVHKSDEMRELTREVAATWLACGLDPEKVLIYRQSDAPEVFELTWILSCFCAKGLLNRAHAYKAKVAENQEAGKKDPDAAISAGLYSYPVLMAADIILYDASEVPVGEDQVQHLEIARDIVQKFNHTYGEVLTVPKAVIRKEGAVIPGLDGRKMSKSYQNTIPLFVEPKKLRKLVMKIKTDSTPPEEPKNPDDSHLFSLYTHFASTDQIEDLRKRYQAGIGWGDAKQALFEAIEAEISPKRERYNHLMSHPNELEDILTGGAQKARARAQQVLKRVRDAIGVGPVSLSQ